MEEERCPPASMDPAGEVAVRGEDRSKEAQEGEGGGAPLRPQPLPRRGFRSSRPAFVSK